MDAHRLTTMVNQIAAFFDSYPENEAVAATSQHLTQFWDPRMRRQLKELIAAGDGGDLSSTALKAAQRL